MKKILALIFTICSLCSGARVFAAGHSGFYVANSSSPGDRFVEIDCLWDYFDSRYVSPSLFYRAGFVRGEPEGRLNCEHVPVPHIIKSRKGYATYHCLLSNLKPHKQYSILLNKDFTVCQAMFVNGICVFNQEDFKRNSKFKQSLFYMRPVTFTADRLGYADLVFYVKNDEQNIGGIVHIPEFAEESFVQRSILKNLMIEMIVAGVFFILAIYNLLIFLLNKSQKMYFHLFCLCVVLLFITCLLDFSMPGYFVGFVPVEVNVKANLFLLGMIVPLYNLYAINLYDIKLRINNLVLAVDFAVPLLVVALPIQLTTRLVLTFMITLYLASFYLCAVIIKTTRKTLHTSLPNIIMIVLMLISAAYGLAGQIYPQKQDGSLFFKFAIMVFAFLQTIVAGVKRDAMVKQIRKNVVFFEKQNAAFARYIPSPVLNYLQIGDPKDIAPGDNSICDAMVMVLTIKNYTELCEYIPTEKAYDLLRRYYEVVAPIVREYGGFISKYVNDEIVVIFPTQSDVACRCAITIQKRAIEIKKAMNVAKVKFEGILCGIHCGKVAIGFMGNNLHINAVACSESIMQASYICFENEKINSHVLLSEKALNYSRTYTECLFDGFVSEICGEKMVLYKVRPFEDSRHDYGE